ncbi:hypothetical protein OIU34_17140 [Pararhizobium sp. BT-229]|uniref:hypothetical protein n=1 Tax=Pararhizobium sp. BT-229 TaxID=2986923 RepID=UPI0021F7EE75|nr:hypothetical protein [Pararhizobium sp. BT-229]MCV9963627.1 hypothetical protein [Pararhizobium sp. BT-229]
MEAATTEVTFLGILSKTEKAFYAKINEGRCNPFSMMHAAAYAALEELSQKELATLLSKRTQAFSRSFGPDMFSGGSRTLKDMTMAALAIELVACLDISGLEPGVIDAWKDSAPSYLAEKVGRYLAGPMAVIVTASGTSAPYQIA